MDWWSAKLCRWHTSLFTFVHGTCKLVTTGVPTAQQGKHPVAAWQVPLPKQWVRVFGTLITHVGRKPTLSYLEKIAAFPPPKTVQELQRFLGTTSYYRGYVQRMAEIAAPLYDLTKKGKYWIWTQECEKAFRDLRRKLMEEPIAHKTYRPNLERRVQLVLP